MFRRKTDKLPKIQRPKAWPPPPKESINAEEETIKKENEQQEKSQPKPRTVFLSGRIDEPLVKTVTEQLIKYEHESPREDIFMYIDSYGGYVDSALAIADTMDAIYCDVQTICLGKAMSAAAMILSHGTKGKRFITPHARLMIHQIWSFCGGSAAEIEVEAGEIKKVQEIWEKLFAKNTGQAIKKVREDMRKMEYMSAEEAIKYGIADWLKVKS